jgi:hypothetical protein
LILTKSQTKTPLNIECLGKGPGAPWEKEVIPLKEGNYEGNMIPKEYKRLAEVDFYLTG